MPLMNLNKKLTTMDRTAMRSYSAKKRGKRFWGKVLLVLVIVTLAIYLPLRSIYSSARQLKVSAQLISDGLKNQNFDQLKQGVTDTKTHISSINGSLNWLFYLRIIPFAGGYYGDAKHFAQAANYEMDAAQTLIASLEPHKQELGFTGTPTPGQDRIAQMVKILDKVLPQIETVEPQLKKASEEVASIDVSKYPEKFGSTRVRDRLDQAKNFIMGADIAVTKAKPALMAAPTALGQPSSKNYLILFQNDKEIRATGGFLTAFAFLTLDKGHLSTSQSDDIYRLDEQLLEICKNKICPLTPPTPIARYLPEADGKPRTAWSMRDSNLSPDLPTSMKQFESMYQILGKGNNFDGIMTIDTQVVEELIAITGPIDVLGTTFSAETDKRCNCPNVIYELESHAEIASKGQADRKAVLGTLMQQVLARSLGSGPEKLPDIINTTVKLANHKHMMFYMHDQKTQEALSQLGWTGQIKAVEGDYLHINDSNFAGGKSNIYVNQTVTYEVDTRGDTPKAKLSIEYKNPQAFNTWLNGINRDYLRIYTPLGSKLVTSKGSDDPVHTLEELGKTYFDAFLTVRPKNSRVITFEYTLPKKFSDKYSLLIQKQPGAKDHHYVVKVNGKKIKDFVLEADTVLETSI